MFGKRIFLSAALCAALVVPSVSRAASCAPSSAGHVITQPTQGEGVTFTEICDGENIVVFESATGNPLRKGIGTDNPQATLDVNGGVKVGNDPGECTAEKAGTIRWTGKAFEGCDGTAWVTLTK
ncbi:MAG: hypothetical protein ACU85E_15050 [Gammaproteobacteria bacterium]